MLLAPAASRAQTLSNSEPPTLSAAYEERKLTDFYSIKYWRTEERLPRNSVNCLLQTADGYLWIGTRNGLARFDGVRFEVYDGENTPELHHNNILSLAEHPAGRLWIGTMEGLTEYSNHRFFWHAIGTVSLNRIWSIAPRKASGVWLGTERGLVLFDGSKAVGYGEYRNTGLPVEETYGVLEDRTGFVWLRQHALARLEPGSERFEVVYPAKNSADGFGRSLGMLEDADGAVWFGAEFYGAGAGLLRCRDGKMEITPSKESGFKGVPGPLCTDAHGGMWLRDDGSGLSYFQGGKFIHYRAPTGMSDDHVECLTPDREGNLWVGTASGGLNRLQPRRLMNFTTASGLAHDSAWSISEGPDGSVWIGTQRGLSRYRDGQFTTYVSATGASEDRRCFVNLVVADQNGDVFTSNGGNLCQVRSNTLVPIYRQEGGTNYPLGAQTIYSDRSRTLWVADRDRLFRRCGTGWEAVPWPDSKPLSLPPLVSLLEDATGAMWVGTKGGVFRLRDGVWNRFTRAEGFPADYAGAALADPDGTVWFASNRGLIRYRNGRFFLFTIAHGLIENLVLNVLEDDFGWFWLNGHQGLQQVRRADLDAVADGRASSFRCFQYGEADGMLSVEGNGGALPNSCKTRDGRLWFPTFKGVVVIDPHSLHKNTVPPPVLIEQVAANGKPIWGDDRSDICAPPLLPARMNDATAKASFAKAHHLGPGEADTVLLRYTANSFMAPDKVRFQYRLEGHDADWVEDRAKLRTAIYTNLRPGKYLFRVRAFNNDGVQSLSDAQFAFSVGPHFYETWAFYALCGGTVLLGAASLHHVRMAALHRIKELQQLHALDEERSRLARDMHDNLGADLTRVMMLAEIGKSRAGNGGDGVADTLEKIAGLSRTMVDGISELVWATNPHKDGVEDVAAYLRARCSEFLEAAGIAAHYDFPEQMANWALSGEVRRHLLLAVKEALANLLKHSQATEVTLTLRTTQEHLLLTIADNGRGFSPVPPHARAPASRPGGGHGLENMRSRLAAVGGSCTVQSACGQGSSVVLQVPLAKPKVLPTHW